MILKIFDDIVNDHEASALRFWEPGAGVCFSDIDAFLAAIPEDDHTIDIRLNCAGGDVTTGWAIVDKLRASGKTIIATVEGMAASMASVVLCAASERKAYPHAQIIIHDPYFPECSLYESYKAEDLDKLSAQLKQETSRILDFYVERTGADRSVLEAIMDEDRAMYADEAKELGFITEILPAISARYKNPLNTSRMKQDKKKQSAIAKAMQALQNALGLDNVASVGYELETADGTTITIDKPEGEDPAVGDAASPDGEHLMPDGSTIVVADGVITEIRPADDTTDEPADEPTDEEIAQLVAHVRRLKANAKTADEQAILDKVAKAGGKGWLDSVTSSHYVPPQRTSAKGSGNQNMSKVAQRLAELKSKNE